MRLHFLDKAKDIQEIQKSTSKPQCFRQSLKKKKSLELITNSIEYPISNERLECLCFFYPKFSSASFILPNICEASNSKLKKPFLV